MTICSQIGNARRLVLAAQVANDDAKKAKETDDHDLKVAAYQRKSKLLSELVIEYLNLLIVDFEHGPGDCISIRLVESDPRSGLHVPISCLSRDARTALAKRIAA
jgi:hypothetical protein